MGFRPLAPQGGNARKLEHFENVDVILLKGHGKGEDVEVFHRTLALETEELRPGLFVLLLIVVVGQEDALAERIGPAVQDGVNLVHPEVRHSDVVRIGIGESDLDLGALRLIDRAVLDSKERVGLLFELPGHIGLYNSERRGGKTIQRKQSGLAPKNTETLTTDKH